MAVRKRIDRACYKYRIMGVKEDIPPNITQDGVLENRYQSHLNNEDTSALLDLYEKTQQSDEDNIELERSPALSEMEFTIRSIIKYVKLY